MHSCNLASLHKGYQQSMYHLNLLLVRQRGVLQDFKRESILKGRMLTGIKELQRQPWHSENRQ